MNYYINIIDTTDDTLTLIVERAAAQSIVLNYEGKDAKDDLAIMGSSLSFTLEVPHDNNVDGAFLHLFTGDETKYRVELRKESDDTLIWIGFLLPDSYSEPYTQGNFFVDFVATDGLGRLKGKYLPDSFYTDEKTVVEFICKCLELTGLELDLYLAPAVQNTSQPLYHTIYLDGLHFAPKEKKQDAYKILKTILDDTLSCCFQVSNQWQITGWNLRNLATYTTQHYNFDTTYVGQETVTRLVKNITGVTLQTPVVTMVPPYNQITVTHTREPQKFPDTIAQEANDGWAILTGVSGSIYATHWNGNNGTYGYAEAPDYYVTPITTGVDTGVNYINLKEKIYLDAGTKIKITMETTHIFVDPDLQKYDVIFDGNIIFSNNSGDITDEEIFTGSGTSNKVAFEYITQTEGLLDVWLYVGGFTYLTKLQIDINGFEDEYIVTDTISEEYTIDKDIDVTFADDKSGFSKCFQLAKLRSATVSYNSVDADVLYGFTQDGNYYSVVSLESANLINDNINTTYYDAVLLEDLEVVYNYNNGEEMVVKTATAITTGNFVVRVYKIDDYTTSRTNWEKWTDAVYTVESVRYCKAVSNVMRRLFILPHQKVDMTVEAIIKPDDIVQWDYLLAASNYVVTNCSWNLDIGESTITIARSIYQNDDDISPGDNIPPIVDAGEDIYIAEGVNEASLDATAFDPDGFIAAYFWEKLSGTGGSIVSPVTEDTVVNGLTGNEYEYQITVTDDDGATASDSVKIFRVLDYTVSLVELSCTTPEPDTAQLVNKECTYQVQVSPALPAGFTLRLEGTYEIGNTNNSEQYLFSRSQMTITKGDGVSTATLSDEIAYENETHDTPFTINYIEGNDIRFVGYIKVEDEDPPLSPAVPEANAYYIIDLNTATFTVGFGNVLGLPDSETETIDL